MRYLPLILIFVAGLVLPANAAESLATVQVPVLDQSAGERQRAVDQALETVVLRLVGREEILATPEVQGVLGGGARYLQQFSYETIKPVKVTHGDEEQITRLAFRASLDIEAIASRLQAVGIPLWARERPVTQVWVAYSTGADRQILRRDTGSGLQDSLLDAIQQIGRYRGLPLALPSSESVGPSIAFTDVWGVFEQPLLDAAEAAGSDNVLAVRLFQEAGPAGGNWIGRFTLLGSALARESWEAQATRPDEVLAAGIERLAELYAVEFSVVATLGGGSEVRLEIENVAGLNAYGRVMKYLSGLTSVESVELRRVAGSTLELTLKLSGTTRALERTIELGRVLQPLDGGEVIPLGSIAGIDFASDRILRYRFLQN